MRAVQQNVAVAEGAAYGVLAAYTLPREAWVDGYYDLLESRAEALLDHPDASVRGLAVEATKEIEVFRRSKDSHGYVFYILRRT